VNQFVFAAGHQSKPLLLYNDEGYCVFEHLPLIYLEKSCAAPILFGRVTDNSLHLLLVFKRQKHLKKQGAPVIIKGLISYVSWTFESLIFEKLTMHSKS